MTNNDVLRSLRYALDLSEIKIVEICKLAEVTVERIEVADLLKKEDEEGYIECSDEIMAGFLDGLIVFKRGKLETQSVPDKNPRARLSNNTKLKKIRVAFELKEEDMHAILALAEFQISKPELSALFRKKGHKNYRDCGDQILRNFLKGLTIRLRG
ncbi:MAG TPA: DUF1456 family protein [Methylophilaceae bacterium]